MGIIGIEDKMFKFETENAQWFFEPKNHVIKKNRVEIMTDPKTDFWQRTYYGFRNDNAHVLYVITKEKYFSFTVKTEFNPLVLFDQCGIAIYQNSNNWVKACIEFHDDNTAWLGSVVTNHGYSDWATTEIGSAVKTMWYRISRRETDYCIENSFDGIHFKQMRIFHFFEGAGEINIGLLACSPGDSSFKAIFTEMNITECLWKEHK
jgi:regulation of enolase protein 1 (concanavalin A-like superfamily)